MTTSELTSDVQAALAPALPREVPLVDLHDYTDGDALSRARFVQEVGDAMRELGFVRVAGHQVGPALTGPAYAAAQQFFALPVEEKRRCLVHGGGGERGYTPFGGEHARDNPTPDLKEFWHTGRELDPGHPLAALYPPNVWPLQPDCFRPAMLSLYEALERCAVVLLEALSIYLQQPPDTLSRLTDTGNTILRALHYPALRDIDYVPGAVRAAAHEDINFITLLVTSTSDGLELLTREGGWLPVNARPGEIVADIGDMLQRLTNGFLPSTTHRVVNPKNGNEARYSLPFFVHPRPDSVISVLRSCRGPGFPTPPPDITGHAFLQERLRELGLISKE
jgi:isopenicillin N synthase-like dioxygenase